MPAPCGKLPLASVESSNPVMPVIISMLRGMAVAWAADDLPLGTFGARKAALAAINANARTW